MRGEVAGIRRRGAIDFGEFGINPIGDRGDLIGRRFRHAFGRHFAGTEAHHDLFPDDAVVHHGGGVAIFGKNESAGFALFAMADGAIFLDEGGDGLRKGICGWGSLRGENRQG